MLMHRIEINKGGATMALMNRANMINSDEWKSDILTLGYEPNYDYIESYLKSVKRLYDDVHIFNMYDDLREKNSNKIQFTKEYYEKEVNLYEKDFFVQDNEYEQKRYARYFKNGKYIKYKKWDKEGQLTHIDFFNENRNRVKRSEFNKDGYHHRDIIFNLNTNKANQERYFTKDGYCYLSKWLDHKTGKVTRIYYFVRKENKVKYYTSQEEFDIEWMSEFFKSHEMKPIAIADGPGIGTKLMEINDLYVHKIFPIHSNHLLPPRTVGSPIRKELVKLFDYYNEAESIVILTEKQKKDIIAQFGDSGNLSVIPNSLNTRFISENDNVKREPSLVSIFSRLTDLKGIPDAIEIFKKVVEKKPEAILNIWGQGDKKPEYQKMINGLNLQNNIYLKGYCYDVHSEMKKSQVVMLTSVYEGFGMVIIEAMANKTPFISYDINYGPGEIIDHKKDGILVPFKNFSKFANAIVDLLESPNKVKKMGENGHRKVLDKYLDVRVKGQWITLFKELIEKEQCVSK